jgi:glycosyltransferase involved in cell wall biosynthesis
MPTILREIPGACLHIAGHDLLGYGRTLEALIDKIGLDGCVRLVGFKRDVPSFMHALDVFAFASRTEGFGQVVIEAMAAGKPVVASRIPPLTEIVVDRETGLLAEPDNPEAFAQGITWLLSHPDEAQEMGRRGLERVQNHFSAERMAAETLALYETVLSQRRRREGAEAKNEAIRR